MGNKIPDWPRKRGDIALIASKANVPRETVRRIVSGHADSVRFGKVQAVSKVISVLARERGQEEGSEKTDEKQTQSRKSSAAGKGQ